MKKILVLTLLLSITMWSCTEQQRAKNYGGTTTIDLPQGVKLVTVTWKGEADIWYLTRPMVATDTVATYTFHQSKGGIFNLTGNGTIIIKESR